MIPWSRKQFANLKTVTVADDDRTNTHDEADRQSLWIDHHRSG